MKHHILVSVKKPTSEKFQDEQSWLGFLSATIPIEGKAIQGERLSENVWLFDRDNDSAVFAHVVTAAARQQLAHSILYVSSGS